MFDHNSASQHWSERRRKKRDERLRLFCHQLRCRNLCICEKRSHHGTTCFRCKCVEIASYKVFKFICNDDDFVALRHLHSASFSAGESIPSSVLMRGWGEERQKFQCVCFPEATDKRMLMCWQDSKSEMRQPIFSDQSCVTKPEPWLSSSLLHGAGMTSIIKGQF